MVVDRGTAAIVDALLLFCILIVIGRHICCSYEAKNIMADLQVELEKLLTSYDEKLKSYAEYLDASKEHNDKIIKLAETQPIDIKDFEEAEGLYDNMVLSEKTYRISKEVYDRYRQDVIDKLAPVQNIKIKFNHAAERGSKAMTDYYIWLKYNPENPDESQLVLQKISDTDNEPKLL